jgi:hypothetical protein
MRLLRLAVPACLLLTLASSAFAQPQLARDHVRGPGGRVAVTIEPDNYPPTAPSYCSAAQGGPCAIDGIDVGWGEASDIGSGVAGYDGPGGFTTGFTYHDGNVVAEECYTYYVSAVDNAGHSGDTATSNTVCIELCIDAAYRGLFLPENGRKALRFANVGFLASRGAASGIVQRRAVRWVKFVERTTPFPTQRRAVIVAGGGGLWASLPSAVFLLEPHCWC